MVFWHA